MMDSDSMDSSEGLLPSVSTSSFVPVVHSDRQACRQAEHGRHRQGTPAAPARKQHHDHTAVDTTRQVHQTCHNQHPDDLVCHNLHQAGLARSLTDRLEPNKTSKHHRSSHNSAKHNYPTSDHLNPTTSHCDDNCGCVCRNEDNTEQHTTQSTSHKSHSSGLVPCPDHTYPTSNKMKTPSLRYTICVVIIVIILVNIVTTSVVTVTLVSLKTSRQGDRGRSKQQRQQQTDSSDWSVTCCDVTQLQPYISEIVSKALHDTYSGRHSWLNISATSTVLPSRVNKHAGHVYLRPNPGIYDRHHGKSVNTVRHEVITDWCDDGNHAYLRDGIAYNNTTGHFRLSEGGVYVVYSRLVFTTPPISCPSIHKQAHEGVARSAERQATLFSQQVMDYGSSSPLLSDSTMVQCTCGSRAEMWACHSSVIVSAVRLTRGSQIYVTATHKSSLAPGQQASLFGFYKID